MAIRVVRLGSARYPEEGLRIGTVRRPPRGVRKTDYASRDFFDVWLPELAPSASLVSWLLALVYVRTALSTRDGATGPSAADRLTECAIASNKPFGGLLL